jgi:hypothetical protein
MEEYEHLLSEETKGLVLDSLYNATKGDEYRVGGVDDDNLYPAYSNPVSRSRIVLEQRQILDFADMLAPVYHESVCVRLDWSPTERGKHDSVRREVCRVPRGVMLKYLLCIGTLRTSSTSSTATTPCQNSILAHTLVSRCSASYCGRNTCPRTPSWLSTVPL